MLLKLFCLPGRALAEMEYLFPRQGNAIASGRRRGNLLVHLTYSASLYIFVIVVAFGIGKPDSAKRHPTVDTHQMIKREDLTSSTASKASPEPPTNVLPSSSEGKITIVSGNEDNLPNKHINQLAHYGSDEPISKQEEDLLAYPLNDPEIRAAVEQARENSRSVTWTTGRLTGTATSIFSQGGKCSSIKIKINELGNDYQPEPIFRCSGL